MSGVPSVPNRVDGSMPVRDHGSFASFHVPSQADIQDHRKQDTVYIGLHVPRHDQRRRRQHRHRSKHRRESDARKEEYLAAAPPSQRVQFLLGEEDEDHQSHDIFCEMAELSQAGEEKEWKETARWIKFEEDVEEGGERWSKPHVATLSLHSLFELRCSLLQGTVMLEMDATTIEQIADIILDNMIASKQLEEHLRDQVRATILCRHRHQNEKRRHKEEGGSRMHLPFVRSLADIGKKYSEPKSMSGHGHDDSNKSTPNFQKNDTENSLGVTGQGSMPQGMSQSDLTENASHKEKSKSSLTSSSSYKNLHFMKKIPPGAEAANIFIGEVDYLTHQIVAFVRLAHSNIVGDLTEVPVPTRFLFLLLGPLGNQNKHHEIGRSIATLMSDEIFHDVAYHAHNREDLLAGIDEFLDQVTVLPPGEWDPSIRIEPPKSIPSQESRKTAGSGHPQPNGKLAGDEETDDHSDPTLVRTGRLFGGLRDDIMRKVPVYWSDVTDALSVQCVASFVFLYFACLTPIITFGGLLGDATDQYMAALESLLAGAICGIVYALCAGQPLTILGSTGPVLVFETILNSFCKDNGINYLEMRLWIGLWTGLFLYIIVAFDLSALVRYITRFTEESFAALISIIFIKEAVAKALSIGRDYPPNLDIDAALNYNCTCFINSTISINSTNASTATTNTTTTTLAPAGIQIANATNVTSMAASNLTLIPVFLDLDFPDMIKKCEEVEGALVGSGCDTTWYYGDIFLFSVLLFIGTFTIAYSLKMSRNASFFPTAVRAILSDFAVLVAILSMVVFDFVVGIHTPKLVVPQDFAPTNPKRGWVINPFGSNPWWCCLAAVAPALLATILIFMDQQITAVIVNRKENKLLKGGGYHLDLFVVASLIIICSLLGLPWFVAATVLSINHVNSLKKESQCSAPGERPKFLGVREQRVTGVSIFLFIGISVLFTSILKYIPMPVLYGVFLYMGVSSLKGMQLIDRISILFMPAKYQPDLMYLRHVRTKRVHLFTTIQVLCLVFLWLIKSIKSISITFPIMVLAMCFVRKGMDYIFQQSELKWLDDIMPESHKREKEDEEIKQEEQRRSLIEDSTSIPMAALGFHSENWAVKAQVDTVNISEEMSKTAMWKSIMSNESSSNLQQDDEDGKRNSSRKHRRSRRGGSRRGNKDGGVGGRGEVLDDLLEKNEKGGDEGEEDEEEDGYISFVAKKHSSKKNGSDRRLGGVEEEREESGGGGDGGKGSRSSPSKKGGKPVKFYIDDHDDHEEKEKLINQPAAPSIVVEPPTDKTPERELPPDDPVV